MLRTVHIWSISLAAVVTRMGMEHLSWVVVLGELVWGKWLLQREGTVSDEVPQGRSNGVE